MSAEAIIILLVALFAAGTLLAGWAGIRSLQRARTVVFYRTRKAYMLAGWQWLVWALILFSSTVVSALLGGPMANQIFLQTDVPVDLPFSTPLPSPTLEPSLTQTELLPTMTLTPDGTL